MEQTQKWTRALFNEQLTLKLREGKEVMDDRPEEDAEKMAKIRPFLKWLCLGKKKKKVVVRFFAEPQVVRARIAASDMVWLLNREKKRHIFRAVFAYNTILLNSGFDVGNPWASRCTVSVAKDRSLHIAFHQPAMES